MLIYHKKACVHYCSILFVGLHNVSPPVIVQSDQLYICFCISNFLYSCKMHPIIVVSVKAIMFSTKGGYILQSKLGCLHKLFWPLLETLELWKFRNLRVSLNVFEVNLFKHLFLLSLTHLKNLKFRLFFLYFGEFFKPNKVSSQASC